LSISCDRYRELIIPIWSVVIAAVDRMNRHSAYDAASDDTFREARIICVPSRDQPCRHFNQRSYTGPFRVFDSNGLVICDVLPRVIFVSPGTSFCHLPNPNVIPPVVHISPKPLPTSST